MPFMVMYRRSDGTSCHEQADAIDEAALFVERLRNNDGVEDDIRIYRMEEISFAFRPYYKVELGMPEKQAATTPSSEVVVARPAPAHAAPPDAEKVVTPVAPVVIDADASTDLPSAEGEAANGRRGLFGR